MEGKEEKAKAEEELTRSRNEILTTLKSIGDAVISTDSKGNVVFMNPVAEDLTGWKENESIGKNIKEIFHIVNEETGDEVESPVARVIKEGTVVGLVNHTILIAKNGSRIPIDDSGAPVKDDYGDITGVVLVFRDITEKRKAEEILLQKTHELGERVKELDCLYRISSLKIIPEITIDEFLIKTIDILPPSWQYPEITTARIIFEENEFKTHNFKESSWKQSAEIKLSGKKAGMIEVYYLEEKPEIFEGPFLKEERNLINALAKSIGEFIFQKRFEEELAIRHKITQIFGAVSDENVFGEILNFILNVMKSKYGVFGFIDENQALVCPSMTRDIFDKCQIPDKDIVFPRETWGESIWARGLIQKKILYSNNLTGKYPDGHIPVTRCITSPILFRGKVIGNLLVGNKETDYTDSDLQLMKMISKHIASILYARLQKDQEEKERKKAEQELKQTIDLSLDFIGIAGLDAYFKRINPTFSRILGYTEEKLLSTPFLDFVHPDDRESTLAEVDKLNEGVKTLSFTNRYRCKDGSYRWLEWKANPIIEEEIMYFVARDITEHRKTEQELKQTIDLSLDFIGIAGFDAYFKRINPTFSRILGYTEEKLLSTPFLDFVHPDDRESTLAEVDKLNEGVKTLSFTNRYRCKDGSYRWLEWHSNPIIEEEKMYFVARDITEHKKAEDELMESEEKFHNFFSAIPDAAFINDQETGDIIDVNEAAVKIYGYSRDEWLKMKNTDVSAEPEKTRTATKSPPAHIPIRYHKKKDGTVFPLEMTAGLYKMKGRNVVFATGRDISERLKIKEELQKQKDELESFASTVSHDLKGRLAILMALADLEETEYSEMMINQIEDLSKLVENLLLLAMEGEILGELSAVNLNELLEKIAKNISTVDPDLKIIIRDLPILNSDPTKLTQVFENILMNVLKHAKATKVEIFVEEDKKEHIIHIRDNGIGMTEKFQEEIRESWKTRKYKSFGMLIVLKIVEAHHGKLVLTSKKGKGTTVSVHFPK